jgi:uncharacterized cupin superfamily protein
MSGIEHVAERYTKERAVREISEKGLWPYSLHAAAGSTYPYHHHETDETLYVIQGELVFIEEQADRQYTVKAGDKMVIPARHGHTVTAVTESKYIMGLKDFIPIEEFPVWHEPAAPKTFFETLAHQFAEAEQYPTQARDYSGTLSRQLPRNPETGEEFYKRMLAEGLKFRRAKTAGPVNKVAFLNGLTNPDNRTDNIVVSDVEVIEYSRDLTLVSLVVTLTGRRGGDEIVDQGYLNVRVFAREPGEWRCVLWFNIATGPGR